MTEPTTSTDTGDRRGRTVAGGLSAPGHR
ncbi:hypothetical protein GA0115242_11301, partial [Streptomyces sp. SolWspMP-5a-2]